MTDANSGSSPLIVQYLYVDDDGRTLPPHPSVRTLAPARYLECALTQSASLRVQDAACDIVLATNVERGRQGRRARRLLDAIADLGVELVPTDFHTRSVTRNAAQASSRFVRDAILAAAAAAAGQRIAWIPNLDCVWFRPARVFAAAPARGEVACVVIPYPPDWQVAGAHAVGGSPRALGELAASMGGRPRPAAWLGTDLLGGTVDELCRLVTICEQLDAELHQRGVVLDSEQQVLSLAGALGRIRVCDLAGVARRIHTGARQDYAHRDEPAALGLWHLPSEKGLSLRRAAAQLGRGRTGPLRTDLGDARRALRRFNLTPMTPLRRVRDDGWLALRTLAARSRPG